MDKKTTKATKGTKVPKTTQKVIEKKTSMKKPVGTFYHPTETTIRQGRCPIGEIMKDGYYRHTYKTKTGATVKGKYVKQACTPNKGKPGKTIASAKVIPKLKKGELSKYGYSTHLSEKDRMKSLIKAVGELSYATVIRKLNAVRTLSKSDEHLFKIYSVDIENLQKWRANHPEAD